MKIKPRKKASYYRWGNRIVCIMPDPESPIGERLMVPKWALVDLPETVLKHYPRLPGLWRKRIQDAIQEREESVN